jgi:hypothetical protein
MKKGKNSIFKNNQDKWEIYLSKYWSYAKWSHIMVSPIKLTGLFPFYKIGAIYQCGPTQIYIYIYIYILDMKRQVLH